MPSPILTDQEIADLVIGTLRNYGRPRFVQIAQTLQEYPVLDKWLKKDKVIMDNGTGIKRTLMTSTGNPAKMTGLYAEDEVNIPDLLTSIDVPWRRATTNWAWETREGLENRGKALITKIIDPRREGALIHMADLLEDQAWSSPDSSSNTTDAYGVPYYVTKNSSTGFNGGVPSGHTTVAGVNVTTHPTYQNYTFAYTDLTKADAISKLRTAHRKCSFKSPTSKQQLYGPIGKRFELFVNEPTIQEFEDVGEQQNENLGRDVASMDGKILFRMNTITWIPQLDGDTSNPVYGIDHRSFYPVVLKGDYLRETAAIRAPKQHNVWQHFIDLSFNFLCLNRRANWVGYIA